MPRPTHDGCCLRRGASAAAASTFSVSSRHRKISTASHRAIELLQVELFE